MVWYGRTAPIATSFNKITLYMSKKGDIMTGEEIRTSGVNNYQVHLSLPNNQRAQSNPTEIGDALRINPETLRQLGESGIRSLGINTELTEKQKEARQKLDQKKSSADVTYKDAKDALAKIKGKYEKDKQYWSTFESKQPKDIMVYIQPYQALDPYKIPEPDRSAYFDALASVMEIEQNNSALFEQTGLAPTTKTPSPLQRNNIQLY